MSKPSSKSVSVKVVTKNGTATSPNDFTSLDKTITFAPGETSAKVTVSVVADEFKEADEDFQLMLYEPINASIETAIGAAFIMNDDTKFDVNEKGYTLPTLMQV